MTFIHKMIVAFVLVNLALALAMPFTFDEDTGLVDRDLFKRASKKHLIRQQEYGCSVCANQSVEQSKQSQINKLKLALTLKRKR